MSLGAVLCRSAYSLRRVCQDLAYVLNSKCIIGKYNPFKIEGTVIIVGNPDGYFNTLSWVHRHNKQIWYITVEGLIYNPQIIVNYMRLKPYVIANSVFTRDKLEQIGLPVDDVIPHGTRYYPPKTMPYKTIKYLYVAGYLKRKYPPYSEPVIKHVAKHLVLVTTRNNPYIKYLSPENVFYSIYDNSVPDKYKVDDIKLIDLYKATKFYLNLSDVEGFGLTVLEAMSYGAIPIILSISPFTDYCNSECCYFYDWTGKIEYEYFGENIIQHHIYDPIQVIRLLDKIRWNYYRARNCMEIAKKYFITNVYEKFKEYIK